MTLKRRDPSRSNFCLISWLFIRSSDQDGGSGQPQGNGAPVPRENTGSAAGEWSHAPCQVFAFFAVKNGNETSHVPEGCKSRPGTGCLCTASTAIHTSNNPFLSKSYAATAHNTSSGSPLSFYPHNCPRASHHHAGSQPALTWRYGREASLDTSPLT